MSLSTTSTKTSSLSTTQILVNETLRNGHLYHSDRVSDLPTVLESEAKELAAHINTSDLI